MKEKHSKAREKEGEGKGSKEGGRYEEELTREPCGLWEISPAQLEA